MIISICMDERKKVVMYMSVMVIKSESVFMGSTERQTF